VSVLKVNTLAQSEGVQKCFCRLRVMRQVIPTNGTVNWGTADVQ